MIDKIDLSGNNYKISDSFRKYAIKRIGKLDRYLPRGSKKDVVAKIVVAEVDKPHNNKYSISVAMKSLAAKSSPPRTNAPTSSPALIFLRPNSAAKSAASNSRLRLI